MNKVLVCITIQENSRRLIKKGFDTAQAIDGELHILHIKKGETIFDHPNSSILLEELFLYGSELGGEVHFLCSNNVTQTIIDFINEQCITKLIIGRPNASLMAPSTICEELRNAVQGIDVMVVERTELETLNA